LARFQQQRQLSGVVAGRRRDVLQVAVVGFGDEALQGGGRLGTAAHHAAVGPAGEQFHLKALQ
jgi:hypothetical protein